MENQCDSYILVIPDNSDLMELFRRNHPRLYHWLNSGLGQTYVRNHSPQAKPQRNTLGVANPNEALGRLTDGVDKTEDTHTLDHQLTEQIYIQNRSLDGNWEMII